MKSIPFWCLFAGLMLCLAFPSAAQTNPDRQLPSKPATKYTIDANKRVLNELNFRDSVDFQNANRYKIAPLPNGGIIKDTAGNVVWNMKAYDYLNKTQAKDAPPEVNPSLWRQEQLNTFAGLFAVVPGQIYQVRGLDLSVMTLIKGQTGWIVMDPLVSVETANAGMNLVKDNLGSRTVSAVIFTHSHIDHYGGVMGLADSSVINSIPIYAPQGFMEHALSENIMAGTAMGRRASYMYGNTMFLHDPRSQVGSGLGKTTSKGKSSIANPTVSINADITNPYDTLIDGVKVRIWNTPNTEAPTEMMFYFPDYYAFCSAEEITQTLHNTYSLRGTQVRDPLAWSQFIDQAILRYGDSVQVLFASHHWPTWGNDTIVELMKKQRDLYKFINDQTLRLANQGYTMIEIGERVHLPKSLSSYFPDRGYYGTINHNVKATYQRYLGWFDGNPANLHSLPPEEAGKKYVQFMGGPEKVVKMAQVSYDSGEYRWVAMVLNHVVFAFPKYQKARDLLADAYEQLGYQAESGPWRNFYLTGARELRDTARVSMLAKANPVTPSRDDLDKMSASDYFQYLSIHVNSEKAEDRNYTFNIILDNTAQKTTTRAVLRLENSVLNFYVDVSAGDFYPTISMPRSLMNEIMFTGGQKGLDLFVAALSTNAVSIKGSQADIQHWGDFLTMLDSFPFWFNIIEP